MLSVNKINTLNSKYCVNFKGNYNKENDSSVAYRNMNKALYNNFVDGDISLAGLIADKISNFWHIATNCDPTIEIKAKMIEEDLKRNAQYKVSNNFMNNIDVEPEYHYNFVA